MTARVGVPKAATFAPLPESQYHRDRSCARKRRYATEWEAIRVGLHNAMRNSVTLKTYVCRYCDGWHLTSHPRE